mmetsp:Transcript_8775/g.14894  ORF Transcript_8775/g.14894 Transcript_8775/m.14894 type:complete len:93 (-) Transcript_8775:88-366(-)
MKLSTPLQNRRTVGGGPSTTNGAQSKVKRPLNNISTFNNECSSSQINTSQHEHNSFENSQSMQYCLLTQSIFSRNMINQHFGNGCANLLLCL